MVLLEVAAQHVRGCSPAVRAALPRGYVAVQPPGALHLGGLLAALLYPDGRGGDVAFAAPGAGAQARVALTFVGGDGQTYRLVRQLGGAGGLQRLDGSTRAFVEVTRDAQQMGQYLRSQAKLPQRTAFEGLFVLSPEQLPSRNPASGERAPQARTEAAGRQRPASERPGPGPGPVDVAEVTARIGRLEQELEAATRIDTLQFRQDGLAGETFALEERLKGVEGLRAALEEAVASHRAAPTAQSLGLPPDIEERIARFPGQLQKREEALARLEAEREEGLAQPVQAVAPFWKDARFVAGCVVGTACLGVGLLGEGALRYLALLDVPAFGVAALVALKWVDDLREAQQGGRREQMRSARERKVREAFEAEARPVKEAVARLGVEGPKDVLELLAQRAQRAARVEALQAELAAAEADGGYREAKQKLQAVRREVEAISEQLQALAGGYVRDPREIERELQRARESLQQPGAALAGEEVPGPGPAVVEGGEGEAGAALEDPAPRVLALAADAAYVDVAEVAAAVKGRAGQYLTALSDRRWTGVELDGLGRARLLGPAGPVPAGEVGGADADLLYVALRLTLVEWLAQRVRVPLVIEAGAAGLGEARHLLLGKMLKQLSQAPQVQVQVLHVSPPPACTALAEGVVPL